MGLDMYLLRVPKGIDLTNTQWELFEDHPEKPEEMSADEWYSDRRNWAAPNELVYWRKENAIHRWFIENCAPDQVDDCTPMRVHSEQLPELYERCQQVLAEHSLAEKLLPTQGGFFFGGTEYDDWYFEGLEQTVKDLRERVIENPELRTGKYDVVYLASW
jgi:hypothetical protein